MRKTLLTAKTAKLIDLEAERKFGISTLVLMENAGAAVARQALEMDPGRLGIAVFCGKGNNGGDGFAAARHLLAKGFKTDVFLAGRSFQVERQARTNLDILHALRVKVRETDRDSLPDIAIDKYGLIIDALLGVGLSGPVHGIYQDMIGLINASEARVLSVDIPSGLDATTGKVLGVCVKADITVTFVAAKFGMVTNDGPAYCGKVVIADLGLPL
jgi:NAD(P)H-hydrate epimerase